jgi:hypothetical protein
MKRILFLLLLSSSLLQAQNALTELSNDMIQLWSYDFTNSERKMVCSKIKKARAATDSVEFFDYEQYLLKKFGRKVTDDDAKKSLKQIIIVNYNKLYCQANDPEFPIQYLPAQITDSMLNDGNVGDEAWHIADFLKNTGIKSDFKDNSGQSLMQWLDKRILESSNQNFKKIKKHIQIIEDDDGEEW